MPSSSVLLSEAILTLDLNYYVSQINTCDLNYANILFEH